MGHARSKPAASFAIDAQLRAIARTQLGLVTYAQATNAGIGKHSLARRRAEGALVEIFPGVMRIDPVEATVEQRILAAGLAVPGSIIIGPSAAAVYQFPVPVSDNEEIHRPVLSIPRTRDVNLAGIRTVRQAVRPPSRRWMTCRLATPTATLIVLPRFVSDSTVERCLDHALSHRLTTVRALIDLIEALPPAGLTGRKLLLELLAARLDGLGHRSRLEQRVAKWLREAGLGGWRSNYLVDVGNGERVEVDFAWPELKVALEVSPFFTHGSRAKQERDAQRRRLLVAAGWRIIEATDRDLADQRAFDRTVQALLCLLRADPSPRQSRESEALVAPGATQASLSRSGRP